MPRLCLVFRLPISALVFIALWLVVYTTVISYFSAIYIMQTVS